MKKRLELCCYNWNSVETAIQTGVYGIELCSNPHEGGVGPSPGFISKTRENTGIFLNVMIRPRGGNFCYSIKELEIMKKDIQYAIDLGADGLVTGILDENEKIDFKNTEMLKKVSGNTVFTFHKAIDVINIKDVDIENLINIGVDRILTSGGQKTALAGSKIISEWIEKYGGKINIVPGGGVRAENIKEIAEKTGAIEFHTSAAVCSSSKDKLEDNLYKHSYITANLDEVNAIMKNLKY
ncbi:MAG: copper homeostasis protein CutC [Bacteroidales bacterium]|nr:copper homeostasis protein CutC [Bacteroidales bacterium]